MADEQKAKLRLEIAHVLFIDIVGYSKLLTDEQSEALQELNQIVRSTEAARGAEAAGELTILPTGDGMALVFTGSVEDPVECALEISRDRRIKSDTGVDLKLDHRGVRINHAETPRIDNVMPGCEPLNIRPRRICAQSIFASKSGRIIWHEC